MAISLSEKRQVVELIIGGRPWPEAIEQVGVRASESTAYRWVRNWRQAGDAGLEDGRHGHAYKMSPEIRAWLKETCGAARHTPSSKVKKMIKDKFEVELSRGHLNRVRAELGVSRPKKNAVERNPLARERRQPVVVSGGPRNRVDPAVAAGVAGGRNRVSVSHQSSSWSPTIVADLAVSGRSGVGPTVGLRRLQR